MLKILKGEKIFLGLFHSYLFIIFKLLSKKIKIFVKNIWNIYCWNFDQIRSFKTLLKFLGEKIFSIFFFFSHEWNLEKMKRIFFVLNLEEKNLKFRNSKNAEKILRILNPAWKEFFATTFPKKIFLWFFFTNFSWKWIVKIDTILLQ